MQPVVKYTPSAKKVVAPVVPSGTLSQRKLKVRNIDANTVTVADLQVSERSIWKRLVAHLVFLCAHDYCRNFSLSAVL